MPISTPRLCPIHVGRESEIAVIDGLLRTSGESGFSFIYVAGEAGSGKSRLQREVGARALETGHRYVVGHCTERDRDLPLAPFVDVLRKLVQSGDHAIDLADNRVGAQLARLLPELDVSSHPSSPELSAGEDQRRLLDAIILTLQRIAEVQPLLLVLEDLHWADSASLDLIDLLARRADLLPICVLGTARPTGDSGDFTRCLNDLRRQRVMTEIELDALSLRQVGRMVEAILDISPAMSFVSAIHERTAGNPFFVEELLAVLPEGHDPRSPLDERLIPASVRDSVLQRLEELDARAREIAEIAAVIGPQQRLEILVRASGQSEEAVLESIEQLVSRQLLVETGRAGPITLEFRHALTRDAIHDRLPQWRRRRLHQIIGEAIEVLAAQPDVQPHPASGELGYHFHRSEDWNRALEYASTAGYQAQRMSATVEASIHFRRALKAALELKSPRRGELALAYAGTLSILGMIDEAHTQLDEALRFGRQSGDVTVQQRALYELAGLYASHDYGRARGLSRLALDLARKSNNQRMIGLALNREGNVLTNLRRFSESRAVHEEAREIFQQIADRWGVADCLDLVGMSYYLAGDVIRAREHFEQAAEMFVEVDDAERVASARTTRGMYLAVIEGPCPTDSSPEAFIHDAEEGLRLCQAIDWRAGEAYAHVALASALLGAGSLEGALTHGHTALAIANEIGHVQWTIIARLTLGLIWLEMLDDRQAREHFSIALESARESGAVQWEERLRIWNAVCDVRTNSDGAEATLRAVAPRKGAPASIGERRALYSLAQIELQHGNHSAALNLLDQLESGDRSLLAVDALFLRGKVLAGRGETRKADDLYKEAGSLARSVGPRTLLWRIARTRSGLWRFDDSALAGFEAENANKEVRHLAKTIDSVALRDRFLNDAGLGDGPSRQSGRMKDLGGPGVLTDREQDVALLIVQGGTNREIARQLSIAEKTVEMHVSNCLGKLGFARRTQIAAWAVEQGLAGTSLHG